MSAGPERYLNGRRLRLGAWLVAASRSAVVCGVFSWLRSALGDVLGVEPVLKFGRVASIGAQLRSAPVYGAVGVSPFAGHVALE
jgi:hypothetical protein